MADYGKGGTHGTLAPFPIGKKVAHADVDLSALLGLEIQTENGKAFRLVRLDKGAGLTTANAEMVAYSYTDQTTYDVDTAASGESVCGVGVEDQDALSDNDYFWLQIQGRCKLIDDGAGVTAGHTLEVDSTAREGEVQTAVAPSSDEDGRDDILKQKVFARAVDTAAADAEITADIIGRLS